MSKLQSVPLPAPSPSPSSSSSSSSSSGNTFSLSTADISSPANSDPPPDILPSGLNVLATLASPVQGPQNPPHQTLSVSTNKSSSAASSKVSCAHGPHLLSAKLNDNGSDNYFNIGSNDFDSSSEWKKSQDDSHERPNKLTQAEHHVNNNNAMSILPAQIITPPMVPVSSKKKSGYFSSNDYSSDFESEDDFALKSSSAQSTRGSEGERAIADEALQVGLGGYSTDFESSGDFDIDNTANDPSKENNSYETDEYSFDFDENEQDFEDAPEQSGTLQATPSFSGPQASSSVPTVKKVQTSEISVQTEHVEVLSKVSEKITLNTPCQTEPDFPYPLSKFVDEYRTHVAKIRETYLQPSLPQRVLHVGGVKNPTSMTRGAPEETWRGGPRAESGCGVLTALLPELKSQPGDDAHLSHTLSTGIDIGTGILNLHSQHWKKSFIRVSI